MALLARVLGGLSGEYARRDRGAQFEQLKTFLTGDQDRGEYHVVAEKLGLSDAAMRTAVHRLRHRYGELLRQEIAATVVDAEEVDDEIRFLLAALGRA